MNTDHPTVTLYFAFAWTYCRLKVYKKDEELARLVLRECNVEFLNGNESSDGWQDFDTCVFLSVVKTALPKILEPRMSKAVAKTLS